jgi:hypothetical protein
VAGASWFKQALAVAAAKVKQPGEVLPSPRGMVLDLNDLPPGWVRKGSRESRTGIVSAGEEWADRVRAANGRSLIVAFRFGDDDTIMVGSQAIPLVSAEDAARVFPSLLQRTLSNPDPGVMRLGTDELEPPPGIGDERRAVQHHVENMRYPGIRATQHVLVWRTQSVLAMLSTGGPAGTWSIANVVALAARQDARIRDVIAGFEPGVSSPR